MTLTWLISGACRGVGKTYLAEHLGAVLPDSVYAKKGRGKIRSTKSANYFTNEKELMVFLNKCRRKYNHVVVEANTDNTITPGRIHIFLDARPGSEDIRRDAGQRRRSADICIGNGESGEQWREVLEGRLDNAALVDTILDILVEQEQFCNRNKTKNPKEK